MLEDVVELRAVLKHADSHEDDLVPALARLEKVCELYIITKPI